MAARSLRRRFGGGGGAAASPIADRALPTGGRSRAGYRPLSDGDREDAAAADAAQHPYETPKQRAAREKREARERKRAEEEAKAAERARLAAAIAKGEETQTGGAAGGAGAAAAAAQVRDGPDGSIINWRRADLQFELNRLQWKIAGTLDPHGAVREDAVDINRYLTEQQAYVRRLLRRINHENLKHSFSAGDRPVARREIVVSEEHAGRQKYIKHLNKQRALDASVLGFTKNSGSVIFYMMFGIVAALVDMWRDGSLSSAPIAPLRLDRHEHKLIRALHRQRILDMANEEQNVRHDLLGAERALRRTRYDLKKANVTDADQIEMATGDEVAEVEKLQRRLKYVKELRIREECFPRQTFLPKREVVAGRTGATTRLRDEITGRQQPTEEEYKAGKDEVDISVRLLLEKRKSDERLLRTAKLVIGICVLAVAGFIRMKYLTQRKVPSHEEFRDTMIYPPKKKDTPADTAAVFGARRGGPKAD